MRRKKCNYIYIRILYLFIVLYRLSSNRRKRKVPTDWTTTEQVQQFKSSKVFEPFQSKITSIAVAQQGTMILVASKNIVKIYRDMDENPAYSLECGKDEITCGLWMNELPIIASSTGFIYIYTSLDGNTKKISTHQSKVTAIALHPSGGLLASVTVDGEWAFHDLYTEQTVLKNRENTGMFFKYHFTFDSYFCQNLPLLNFIQMAISLDLEQLLGKLKYIMLKRVKMSPILIHTKVSLLLFFSQKTVIGFLLHLVKTLMYTSGTFEIILKLIF